MKHLFGELNGSVINFIWELETRMESVSRLCDLHVVSKAFHQFEPIGVTGVLVLSESHFSAHTYPENGKIYLDVFCCNPNFDPKFCADKIEDIFGGKLSWNCIERGS